MATGLPLRIGGWTGSDDARFSAMRCAVQAAAAASSTSSHLDRENPFYACGTGRQRLFLAQQGTSLLDAAKGPFPKRQRSALVHRGERDLGMHLPRYRPRSSVSARATSRIFTPRLYAWLVTPCRQRRRPAPSRPRRTVPRGSVEATRRRSSLAREPSRPRAAASQARGSRALIAGRPTGMSTPTADRLRHPGEDRSWKFVSLSARRKRPSARTTPTHPPLQPSTPSASVKPGSTCAGRRPRDR